MCNLVKHKWKWGISPPFFFISLTSWTVVFEAVELPHASIFRPRGHDMFLLTETKFDMSWVKVNPQSVVSVVSQNVQKQKLGLTNKLKKSILNTFFVSFCQTWGICLLDSKYVLNTFRSGANCLYRGHTREYKRLASCLFHELICKSNLISGTGRAILPLSCRLWKTALGIPLCLHRHVKTQRGNTFWEMWSDTEPCKQ